MFARVKNFTIIFLSQKSTKAF